MPRAAAAPTTVHAALLARAPKTKEVERVRAYPVKGEGIEVIAGVAYLHTPFGSLASKMAAKFDKCIGVTNTAWNWSTVLKLAQLGRVAEQERQSCSLPGAKTKPDLSRLCPVAPMQLPKELADVAWLP